MPRRGRARRTHARRARARGAHRTHFTARQHRTARTRHRHHRRNIIRSGGTRTTITASGSHNAAGIPLRQKRERAHCMAITLIFGLVLVTIGLTVTFQVSISAGIAPISLGILSIAAGFILCITNFNKPMNRTVELTATPVPNNIPTAPVFVPDQNVYSDQAPAYAATIGLPANTGMQYGAFESPASVNPDPPPPSYAEATMQAS